MRLSAWLGPESSTCCRPVSIQGRGTTRSPATAPTCVQTKVSECARSFPPPCSQPSVWRGSAVRVSRVAERA
eukprot:3068978-Pleurochrysis_carterae.AAC.2